MWFRMVTKEKSSALEMFAGTREDGEKELHTQGMVFPAVSEYL